MNPCPRGVWNHNHGCSCEPPAPSEVELGFLGDAGLVGEDEDAQARLEAAADALLAEAEEDEADLDSIADEWRDLGDRDAEEDEWAHALKAGTQAAKRYENRLRYSSSRDADDVAQEAALEALEYLAKGKQISSLSAFVYKTGVHLTTRTEDTAESSLDRKARKAYADWTESFVQANGRMPKSSETLRWREDHLASYEGARRKPNRERLMRGTSVRVNSIDASNTVGDSEIARDYTAEESVFGTGDGTYYDEDSWTAKALAAQAEGDKVLMRRYFYNTVAEEHGLPTVSDGFLTSTQVQKSRKRIKDAKALAAHIKRFQAGKDTDEETAALFSPWADQELTARQMDDLCVLFSTHQTPYEAWDSAMRLAAKPRAGSKRATDAA